MRTPTFLPSAVGKLMTCRASQNHGVLSISFCVKLPPLLGPHVMECD